MNYKKIGLAADHAGFALKAYVITYLESLGIETVDFGTYSEESTDYADYAHPLASAVEKKEVEIGFAICGSGNGINMTVNKHAAIRAAICWKVDISEMARAHNDANICTLPARYISFEEGKAIVDAFLNTPFEGGRHIPRINKIPC